MWRWNIHCGNEIRIKAAGSCKIFKSLNISVHNNRSDPGRKHEQKLEKLMKKTGWMGERPIYGVKSVKEEVQAERKQQWSPTHHSHITSTVHTHHQAKREQTWSKTSTGNISVSECSCDKGAMNESSCEEEKGEEERGPASSSSCRIREPENTAGEENYRKK